VVQFSKEKKIPGGRNSTREKTFWRDFQSYTSHPTGTTGTFCKKERNGRGRGSKNQRRGKKTAVGAETFLKYNTEQADDSRPTAVEVCKKGSRAQKWSFLKARRQLGKEQSRVTFHGG